jgi:hypothetical protein
MNPPTPVTRNFAKTPLHGNKCVSGNDPALPKLTDAAKPQPSSVSQFKTAKWRSPNEIPPYYFAFNINPSASLASISKVRKTKVTFPSHILQLPLPDLTVAANPYPSL